MAPRSLGPVWKTSMENTQNKNNKKLIFFKSNFRLNAYIGQNTLTFSVLGIMLVCLLTLELWCIPVLEAGVLQGPG